MNKFKAGDKVTVKENFWEIESGVYVYSGMKKLVGRILEVQSISSSGNFYTKQDDSNDNTSWAWDKNWLELYNPTITWETLKWKDVVINGNGKERMVLVVSNDVVTLSESYDFEKVSIIDHKKQMQDDGYTIKQATPTLAEKLELTLDQIAEKFGVYVTNIKIKK